MEKQGLELFKEKLEQAGKNVTSPAINAGPLPPALQEFVRKIGDRNSISIQAVEGNQDRTAPQDS